MSRNSLSCRSRTVETRTGGVVFPVKRPGSGFTRCFAKGDFLTPISASRIKVFGIAFRPNYEGG